MKQIFDPLLEPMIQQRYIMRSNKKNIYCGYELQTTGIIRPDFFQDSDFTRAYYPISVQWHGVEAYLRYWNYRRVTPLNPEATKLIRHPGFIVRGQAIVVTSVESWHKFCLPGSKDEARAKLASIQHTFSDHVIYKSAGRHQTHTSICVRNEDDAFAIRMAL